jgi:peptidyl-prolyl cis-trans isomerase A (cyclophilin A)
MTLESAWAPIGADRFYALVTQGYYNDNAFFRVIQSPKPFVAQWGISSDPAINKKWFVEDRFLLQSEPGQLFFF